MSDLDSRRLYVLLGKTIRQLRENHQPHPLSQAQLAGLLGIERTSITNIESGSQRPPLHLIYMLCQVFSKDPAELLPSLDDLTDKQISVGKHVEPVPPKAASVIDKLQRNG